MHTKKIIASLTLLGFLTACGNDPGDRALSGAGIGAGAGTVAAVIVNGNPLMGAAVGAAAGAITGAMTKEENLNMGKPIWR